MSPTGLCCLSHTQAAKMAQSWREWLFGSRYLEPEPTSVLGAPASVEREPSSSDAPAQPPEPSTRASAWHWLLLLVPWPIRQPAAPDWDPSNGVGDWQARLAVLHAADSRGAEEEEEDDDDDNDEGGGGEGEAAADEVEPIATPTGSARAEDVAHLPDSQLTEAQLLARHPWLTQG